MEQIYKDKEKIGFVSEINESLANAIRRSVSEIPTLAIEEVDIYKNDSALYDEIIAHRLGLIPLENQKVKDKPLLLKLKVSGGKEGVEVLAKELGKEVVFPEIPIVLLEKDQELELVAKAIQGTGKKHAKNIPGLVYYRKGCKIKIEKEGEKHKELAELYPNLFEFNEKLKVKNSYLCDLEQEDVKEFKGISIEPTEEIIFFIESWGMMDVKELFLESIKALKENLNEVEKALK